MKKPSPLGEGFLLYCGLEPFGKSRMQGGPRKRRAAYRFLLFRGVGLQLPFYIHIRLAHMLGERFFRADRVFGLKGFEDGVVFGEGVGQAVLHAERFEAGHLDVLVQIMEGEV
jgi:hypothetical protein